MITVIHLVVKEGRGSAPIVFEGSQLDIRCTVRSKLTAARLQIENTLGKATKGNASIDTFDRCDSIS